LLPCSILYLICLLAETNRIPFDLLEAEAELVAGYYTEFSGFWFASFFLSEYGNILLMSSVYVCLFLGGGQFFLSNINLGFIFLDLIFYFKVIILIFIFIFLRANLPRFRFDQLMIIGWKILLPVILSFIFFYLGILIFSASTNWPQLPYMTSSYISILVNSSSY